MSTVTSAFDSALGGLTIAAAKDLAVKCAREGVTAVAVDDIAAAITAVGGIDAGVAKAAAEAAKTAILDRL